MGDYSRNPETRLTDSVAKHYVAVRLQQGVPVLDADWNELDGLGRAALEDIAARSLGDGVPVGSNAFNIVALPGGGVDTIVLASNSPTIGLSSVSVDVAASTAAASLGFTNSNSFHSRNGASPAQITGHATEPFALANGDTLVVEANDQAPETTTFNAADFADISAATAAEVVAAIAAAAPTVTASAGDGNDFIIKGGGGTFATAARIMVDGRMTLIESATKYSEQPLFNNPELAAAWGVAVLDPLATAGEAFVVYLDIWDREVAGLEDEELLDIRIGVETALRLRREWVVRVAPEANFLTLFNARPPGHSFYRLALLQRQAGNNAINAAMITDERETDVSLLREIAYRGSGDLILVDTGDFRDLLTATRDVVREFIVFLASDFVDPNDAYAAGEVMGIDALSAIANVADQGLALLAARSMGTRDATTFFRQLVQAEERFITVWTDFVLPLNKPGGQIYNTSFATMVSRINQYLAGPAPSTFSTIPNALDRGDLESAVRSQERINTEFGRELDRPVGSLSLTYLGSTTPVILRNQSFDLRYEVTGSVTPEDDIDIEVFINPQWATTLRNGNGSIPFALQLGPGDDDAEFIVSVQAPDVSVATTQISLEIFARQNRGGLFHLSTQKTLTINNPPPPSEEAFVIGLLSTNLSQAGGVFQFPATVPGGLANLNFQVTNNTTGALTVDMAADPDPAAPPAGWTILAPALQNIVVPALGSVTLGFSFLRPAANGATLNFSLSATEDGTTNVVGEMQVTIVTVA
jgi:hypothetical protein